MAWVTIFPDDDPAGGLNPPLDSAVAPDPGPVHITLSFAKILEEPAVAVTAYPIGYPSG